MGQLGKGLALRPPRCRPLQEVIILLRTLCPGRRCIQGSVPCARKHPVNLGYNFSSTRDLAALFNCF